MREIFSRRFILQTLLFFVASVGSLELFDLLFEKDVTNVSLAWGVLMTVGFVIGYMVCIKFRYERV